MPVKISTGIRPYGVVVMALIVACGPEASSEDGPPPDDMAWLIDSFAHGCEGPITQCWAGHHYEFVFEPDGTLQTYDIVCGVREPAQLDREARWRPTDEYGVAEILPREGKDSFKATFTQISNGFVRRTDDCLVIDVDFDGDGSYFVPFYRGVFIYEMSACVSKARHVGEPTCPDSAAPD